LTNSTLESYLENQISELEASPSISFPHAKHADVASRALSPSHNIADSEFPISWAALPLRFACSVDHAVAFVDSLREYGTVEVTELDRYRQEKEIFDLFSTTICLVETGFYALFMLAVKTNPTLLNGKRIKKRKDVDPVKIKEDLSNTGLAPDLLYLIKEVLESDQYRTYLSIRNIVNHRRITNRTIYLGGDNSGEFAVHYETDTSTTDKMVMSKDNILSVLRWQMDLLDRFCNCGVKLASS
jgi:hypothetical protein